TAVAGLPSSSSCLARRIPPYYPPGPVGYGGLQSSSSSSSSSKSNSISTTTTRTTTIGQRALRSPVQRVLPQVLLHRLRHQVTHRPTFAQAAADFGARDADQWRGESRDALPVG